jgi:hypothetical protein
VFLIIQNFTDFDFERHKLFFIQLSSLTISQSIRDFEKFSGLLINNINFSGEFLERLSNIGDIKITRNINII